MYNIRAIDCYIHIYRELNTLIMSYELMFEV